MCRELREMTDAAGKSPLSESGDKARGFGPQKANRFRPMRRCVASLAALLALLALVGAKETFTATVLASTPSLRSLIAKLKVSAVGGPGDQAIDRVGADPLHVFGLIQRSLDGLQQRGGLQLR